MIFIFCVVLKIRHHDIYILCCTKNKNNNFPEKYVLLKIKNTKPLPYEVVLDSVYSDTTIHIDEMGL